MAASRLRSRLAGFAGFLVIVLLYLVSVFSATDIRFLPRRINGLIQLTYSIIIGYALFLTVTQASRRQIAGLFLGFSLVILVGCLLEEHAGLRPVSDAVRKVLYSKGVYENDLRDIIVLQPHQTEVLLLRTLDRDLLLHAVHLPMDGGEPLALEAGGLCRPFGLGLFAMPGPTLLLMLLLMLPYMLFLASRKAGRLDVGRLLIVACIATVFFIAFVMLGRSCFPRGSKEILSGNDPSFFYRVQGPALAGFGIIDLYPFAGAGLTGEPFSKTKSRTSICALPATLPDGRS